MLKHHYKKLATVMLAFMLVLGCIGATAVQTFAASTTTIGNAKYSITSATNLTAQYEGTAKKSATSASIPDTITISGKTYKVTSVANNALKGNRKIKNLTIGKNVEKIGKNAFSGCKALKNITINTTALTKTSVGAKAFKGLNANAAVTVPSNKLDDYKTLLKSRGLTGKKQKVEGKAGEEEKNEEPTELTFGPDNPLPDPEDAALSICDISNVGTSFVNDEKVIDDKSYIAGDTITFSSRIVLAPSIYGMETYKEASGHCIMCNDLSCQKNFLSVDMYGAHFAMTDCRGGYWEGEKSSFKAWEWIPDPAPCKVVYRYTLPLGLSYKKDSVKVKHQQTGEIDNTAYHVNISGQELTVTIDDIKATPYYRYNDNYIRYPISVVFDTEMNNNTSVDNAVTATISYSYKGEEKTVDLGSATIHAASLQVANTDSNGSNVDGAKFDLYLKRTIYPEGSNLGTVKWIKIKENISAGDVVTGLGELSGRLEGTYRIVQSAVPNGYKKASNIEFDLSIDSGSGKTVISAVDSKGNALPVDNSVIKVNVVN